MHDLALAGPHLLPAPIGGTVPLRTRDWWDLENIHRSLLHERNLDFADLIPNVRRWLNHFFLKNQYIKLKSELKLKT